MNNFLGKKINGEISHYSSPIPEQDDPQNFLIAIENVLNIPEIESIRWEGFTPYFNDGEACQFSIYDPGFKLKGYDDIGDYEDGYLYSWNIDDYIKLSDDSKEKINAAAKAIAGGTHYIVLAEKFGDPAQVTAKLNDEVEVEFNVEFYDHD